jgi:drug/metabolite transporter (DMT)-like permease
VADLSSSTDAASPQRGEDDAYQQSPPRLCSSAHLVVRGSAVSVTRQLAVFGLMLALAGIDFAGALVAQDFADRRRMLVLLLGCGLQVVLFLVYVVALRLASLSIVTMGWIVLLQVALFATDLAQGRLHPGATQWAAVVLVLVAQAYLVATTTTTTTSPSTPPSTATGQNPPPGATIGVSMSV